jgi:Lrp/AsnC family transcriptional regulator, leucine-responsive regulatory protein
MADSKAAEHRQFRDLGRIDRKILRELQSNGRLSYAELSRKVGLTSTPCLERVKRLEKEGFIRGYSAVLEPEKVEAAFVVFVMVKIARTSQNVFDEFEEAIKELPEVQECYLVSGNFDFLLKARVTDMSAYRAFYGEKLLSFPGIQESTSYTVMEQVKETLEIPVSLSTTSTS